MGSGTRKAVKVTKKRDNGTGSLYKDARGRWVGEVVIDGRKRRVMARTKVDAGAKLSKLLRDAGEGIVVADGNVTVKDITARWRERELASRKLAPSTRGRYEWALDQIDAELGTTRLRGLDVNGVERALDRIGTGRHGRGKQLSRASVARVRDVLVMVLDFAVRRNAMPSNPARLAIVSPTAPAAQPRQALEHDDADALWRALDGERLGPLFRVMLMTGLRPGEALGLCWDAVDLDRAELTVRRAVRIERGAARLVDDLKTSTSYRTIAVPEPALAELRRQGRAVNEMKIAARTWTGEDQGLVFPTTTGGPWNPKNVRRELARICEDNGLVVVRPNELRHSAASILNDKGVRLELIADLLGHSSTRMLDQTYRHRPRRAVDAHVDVMGDLFADTGKR